LNDDRTRQAFLGTDPLKNLESCSDQLIESHAQCAQSYPNFKVPFAEFRAAVAAAAAKYLIGFADSNAQPSRDELRRFIGELKVADLYLGLA